MLIHVDFMWFYMNLLQLPTLGCQLDATGQKKLSERPGSLAYVHSTRSYKTQVAAWQLANANTQL